MYKKLLYIVTGNGKLTQDGFLHTSLLGLRLEKTLRGHLRCRCPEHQLRMLSHSTVLDGPGPSSLCRRTSCFRARTAVFSSICSNYRERDEESIKSVVAIEFFPSKLLTCTRIPLPVLVPGPPGQQWVCSPPGGCSAESMESCCCQSGIGRFDWCLPAGPASQRDDTREYWNYTENEDEDQQFNLPKQTQTAPGLIYTNNYMWLWKNKKNWGS